MLGKWAKSFILLAGLSGLLLFAGSFFGEGGLTIALIIALAMNGFAYFFSDKLAIKMAQAQPMDEAEYPGRLPHGAPAGRQGR
jgi:heat shock protein HtpX